MHEFSELVLEISFKGERPEATARPPRAPRLPVLTSTNDLRNSSSKGNIDISNRLFLYLFQFNV